MKRFTLILLLAICYSAIANPIYVSGIKYAFNHNDFSSIVVEDRIQNEESNTLALTVPILGDTGQDLTFNIDAQISGRGQLQTNLICADWKTNNGSSYREKKYAKPAFRDKYWKNICDTNKIHVKEIFAFEVEMDVSCSGIHIGSSTADESSPLEKSTIREIHKNASKWIGQLPYYSWPQLYDKPERNTQIVLNKSINTSGNCQELLITLKGNKTFISNIDLNIFVLETF